MLMIPKPAITLSKRKILTVFSVSLILIPQAFALKFSGESPGKPQVGLDQKSKSITLENKVISVTWQIKDNQIYLQDIENKLTKTHLKQTDSPVFSFSSTESKEAISGWKIVSKPRIIEIKALQKSSSKGKLIPGKAVIAAMENPATGLKVYWMAELRNDANYIISNIAISGKKPITLNRISLLYRLNAPNAKQVGSTHMGAPVTVGQTFFGTQVPFFKNAIGNGMLTQEFDAKLPIKKGVTTKFSQVIGVFNKDHLRRDFLYYLERERSRSYKPFLHYNCWFDLERSVSEKGMLNRINKINNELGEKRGVQVVSYVVDDGYDDYSKGFWVFNTEKFPHGFKPLAKRLEKIHSHLGVWLSPAGGYVGTAQRIAQAKKLGIPSLDLSHPEYYKWFLDRHLSFIKNAEINYFKWDKLGGGVSGHFMALMDIAQKLREVSPELFINTTVGTWQSPFWLNQVDCTWRGGNDMGFKGKGNNREQWMTYRDGVTYDVIKKSAFIYPLNAIMNHGIIYANGHPFPRKTLGDKENFSSEARSFFGGGYALQELYLTPDILGEKDWDILAESAKWAKKNAPVLIDSHFIGGNPNKLEVYGFAAWGDNHGTLTLRNPDDQEKTIQIDIGKAFELPEGAATSYTLTRAYGDQRIKTLKVTAGSPVSIELQPFEVLVFDATPSS
jgi:hypothetical protein